MGRGMALDCDWRSGVGKGGLVERLTHRLNQLLHTTTCHYNERGPGRAQGAGIGIGPRDTLQHFEHGNRWQVKHAWDKYRAGAAEIGRYVLEGDCNHSATGLCCGLGGTYKLVASGGYHGPAHCRGRCGRRLYVLAYSGDGR